MMCIVDPNWKQSKSPIAEWTKYKLWSIYTTVYHTVMRIDMTYMEKSHKHNVVRKKSNRTQAVWFNIKFKNRQLI